jgi:hypothetical protein
MAKEAFIDYHPQRATQQKIDWANNIIDEYQEKGYFLSLRQLYYQLVARGLIVNNKQSYCSLSDTMTNARLAGLVDWEAIEDRGRYPRSPLCYGSIGSAIKDTANSFRIDRQQDQTNYVEVWCEKDALSGILSRTTYLYGIPLIINKGYGSATSSYNAAQRIKLQQAEGKFCTILYLGDHDPSGLDMVRDVNERLRLLKVTDGYTVKHIALTTEQVEKYNPPENKLKEDNYGKLKDPRGIKYFKEFGNRSWEVDALSPEVLSNLLEKEIESTIDMRAFWETCHVESEMKNTLGEIAARWEGF